MRNEIKGGTVEGEARNKQPVKSVGLTPCDKRRNLNMIQSYFAESTTDISYVGEEKA